MQAQWNTGRLYTAAGQRIVAEIDGRKVLFNDIDRMISGEFEVRADLPVPETHHALRAVVTDRYDRNDYRISVNAMRLRWSD